MPRQRDGRANAAGLAPVGMGVAGLEPNRTSSPQPPTGQSLAPKGVNSDDPSLSLSLSAGVEPGDPPTTFPRDAARVALYREILAALDALPEDAVRATLANLRRWGAR